MKPKIYLVGRPSIDQEAVKQFIDDHKVSWVTDSSLSAELLCELAGRLCYMSFGKAQGRKTNKEYLSHVIESQHGSVLEHAVWNFILTGVSRSLTHELVRHRAGWGYSQLSQRYVDESNAEFIEPDIIVSAASTHAIWETSIKKSHAAYAEIVGKLLEAIQKVHPELSATQKRKMARQAARSVLPNATETKIFVTANARALRHFIELRGHPAADTEIRELAVGMLQLMQKEAPNLFGDYEIYVSEDKTVACRTAHRKV